jgi:trimeric autotransporter adhesin
VWKDQAGSASVFDLGAGNNSGTNAASGVIDGEVAFAHSHNTFDNAGTVDGRVSIAAGSDTFTNAGTIDGEVKFWSTGTGNSMTNSGAITGGITLPGSSSAANHGQIYGDMVLGASDTLVNTGTIHGNVTLGASDTFDVSPGIVTGVVNAGASDLFEFSGDFGKVTFNDFVGGTGTNHDTIQFAANDFSTFSQVQAASSQAGSDVVIKLDATDSITLNNVTLSSLASADFTFV